MREGLGRRGTKVLGRQSDEGGVARWRRRDEAEGMREVGEALR